MTDHIGIPWWLTLSAICAVLAAATVALIAQTRRIARGRDGEKRT